MFLGLQRFRDLIGAYLFAGAYYASIVPFFIISRFRLPVVPALAVLASLALWRILDLWRNGRRAHACLAVAAALLLGAAATFPRNVRRIPPNDFDNVAKAAAARNDTAEAIYLLRRSLSLRPRQHLNLYMLGALLAKEGRADEAIRYLEEAVRVRPDDPRPYRTLGLVYAREKKDPARALEWLGLYTKRETDPERRAHIEGLARSLRASLKGRPDS
jgi:tetratricopeptide (TPR) repeat protein